MNTSKTNAGRLVMTESAYFSSVSQKDAFNDLEVEMYEIVATLTVEHQIYVKNLMVKSLI